jgi:poly(ADP-ribose) polymerase-like protein
VANHIDVAKTGRATCRTCKKAIAKGELRLGVETPSQFNDAQLQWHHLACAADKLPVELGAALAAYPGPVANREALDHAIAAAIAGGHAKPAGFPYVDHAPTGRASCLQCRGAIDKGSVRVAIERELETGAMVTRGAGYLHPRCVKANQFETEGGLAAIVAGVRTNSRLPEAEVAAAIAAIEAGEG